MGSIVVTNKTSVQLNGTIIPVTQLKEILDSHDSGVLRVVWHMGNPADQRDYDSATFEITPS